MYHAKFALISNEISSFIRFNIDALQFFQVKASVIDAGASYKAKSMCLANGVDGHIDGKRARFYEQCFEF